MNYSRILPILQILFLFLFTSLGIHKIFLFPFVQNLAPQIYSYSYSWEKYYSLIPAAQDCNIPFAGAMFLPEAQRLPLLRPVRHERIDPINLEHCHYFVNFADYTCLGQLKLPIQISNPKELSFRAQQMSKMKHIRTF